MANRTVTSPEILRQLVAYDPDTGILTWRVRPREFFQSDKSCRQWNARYSGTEALGCVVSTGYKHGQLLGQHELAHRVAWAVHHGKWPDEQIDHINGVRGDNRIANLRDVNRVENGLNQKIPRDNQSGRIGVSLDARSGAWVATIRKEGKRIHIGRFEDFRLACAARLGAEVALGYHKNHGRS